MTLRNGKSESSNTDEKQNDWKSDLKQILWMSLNAFLIAYNYSNFYFDERFDYLFLILGHPIYVARTFGFMLNFNCAFILLPTNRILNSWVRSKILKYLKSAPRRMFDHSKSFHLLTAGLIIIFSLIHTVAHGINLINFRKNFVDVVGVDDLNIEKSKQDTNFANFLRTVPGWTGIILIVVLALMIMSSFKLVRRMQFEIFHYSHQLAFVFLGVMMFHGFGKITKFQTNIDKHPVSCHSIKTVINSTECLEPPTFTYVEPAAWKWLILPLFLHILDRVIRFVRSLRWCEITSINIHNGSIIELCLFKKGFKAKPGQYIMLQCQDIAEFEWHAFTLTRCPVDGDGKFSVHMKICGDWTEKLQAIIPQDNDGTKRLGNTCIVGIDQTKVFPAFRVSGPYGSPNEDAFKYPVNISVGAGIGITPYAAVLNYLKDTASLQTEHLKKLQKMNLFLVCKTLDDFSWVVKLVKETKKKLASTGYENLLTVNLFLTQVKKPEEQTSPEVTAVNMNYGRPKFDVECLKVAENHPNDRIGVFFCGPPSLGKMIFEKVSGIKDSKNIFIFNKESFG